MRVDLMLLTLPIAAFQKHLASSFVYNGKQVWRRSFLLASSTTRATTKRRAASSSSSPRLISSDQPFASVRLHKSRQSKAFRNGNQLVFTKAVEAVETASGDAPPRVGDLVQVRVQLLASSSTKEEVLGWGVYNPHSLYRVRFLCHRQLQPTLCRTVAETLGKADGLQQQQQQALYLMIHHHLLTAWKVRESLFLTQDNLVTDTYRWINGEGDGLSGLAVDIVGNSTAVVMSSALWCQRYQETVLRAVRDVLPSHFKVTWKVAPGRLEQDGQDRLTDREKVEQQQPPLGDLLDNESEDTPVIFHENGVKFVTYPFGPSQKTSVYCDQRENRLWLTSFTRDKLVLDLCCYHAGFSLTALIKGEAREAVAVDSSATALSAARENAVLNGISLGDERDSDPSLSLVQSDVTEFLQNEADGGKNGYDVIILDPPKLAPSVKGLDKARRKYHALNRDAIKVANPAGGLLLSCTCSAAMTQQRDYFLSMVQGAALAAGRQVTLMRVAGAASCHTQSPIAWPTGAYLTAALFYVHPLEDEQL